VNSAPDQLQLLDARSQANEDGDGTVEAVTKVVRGKKVKKITIFEGKKSKNAVDPNVLVEKMKGRRTNK
jgi:hypothetical protein